MSIKKIPREHVRRAVLIAVTALFVSIAVIWQMAPRPPITVYYAIDGSTSYKQFVDGAIKMVVRSIEEYFNREDTAIVTRFDGITQDLHSDKVSDTEHLRSVLVKRMTPVAARNGTCPDLMWCDVSQRLRDVSEPSAIAIYSDGDFDSKSPESIQRLRVSVERLAANKHVVFVAILGVLPQNRAELAEYLAPFGSRLHLYDADEADMTELMSAIDAARWARKQP